MHRFLIYRTLLSKIMVSVAAIASGPLGFQRFWVWFQAEVIDFSFSLRFDAGIVTLGDKSVHLRSAGTGHSANSLWSCDTINYRIYLRKSVLAAEWIFSKQQVTFVTCSCLALCHVAGTCSLLCANFLYTSSYFLSSMQCRLATATDLSFTLKQ